MIIGEVLAHEIKKVLIKSRRRGQGCDGATNMSGTNSVQDHLAAEKYRATYGHCIFISAGNTLVMNDFVGTDYF